MKKLMVACLMSFALQSIAQIHDPVKWGTSVQKISDTEYELIATATIEGAWHLYSQSVPKNGPRPTVFSFEGNRNYLKKGNTKEEEGHTIDDPVFGMRIKYFGEKATFKQRIRLKAKDSFQINAIVEFMVCDDKQCLPPKEVDLTFDIK